MNFITQKHLSRRTVLKGLGADDRAAVPRRDGAGCAPSARRPQASVRLVAMEMVHGAAGSTAFGAKKNLWAPAATGSAFDLSPTRLAPLEPWREYLTIVSNTDVRNAEAFLPPEIGGDHFRSAAVFLTQSHPQQTQGSDLLRRHVARSVVRAEVRPGDADAVDAAVHRERRSGRRLLLRLFVRLHRLDQLGDAGRAAADDSRSARGVRSAVRHRRHAGSARRARRRDIAASSTGSRSRPNELKRTLGAADQGTPADYLEDVREIERRIQKVEAQNARGEARELPGAPIGVPDSYDEHVKLMFDMQVVAFASDVTRVVAFKLSRDVSNRVYPETGVNTGFHIASHHGEREDRILDLAKINSYHVSLVPYFLKKLKDTPDGDSNLLENSLLIYGSPMGNSNVHNHKRCPLFLAGHAGGALKGNLHIKAADGTPMANAMLGALRGVGLELDTFGDSNAVMDLNSRRRRPSRRGMK